jgi:hypothetical protein
MAINSISGNILQDNLQRGADLSIQGNLIYFDIVNNRVGIKTSNPSDDFEVDGIFRVGNVVITAGGNINAGNVNINNLAAPVANSDAATKFYADNIAANSNIGNFTFSNTTISTSVSPGNITLLPTANSTVIIDTVSGLVIPVGNTAQRPSPAATGTIRYNTESERIEVYDGTEWDLVASDISSQLIIPDGTSVNYALDRSTTASAILVITNGVVQTPTLAYSVAGNLLSFVEAPLTTDTVDIRFL